MYYLKEITGLTAKIVVDFHIYTIFIHFECLQITVTVAEAVLLVILINV
jgi:hypothetical protein